MMNKGKILTAAIATVSTATGVVGAVQAIDTVVERHEYNNVHEIVEYDTYTINGKEVNADDWKAYLEEATDHKYTIEIPGNSSVIEKEEVTIKVTEDDLDTDGIARLSTYIDFGFDNNGEVCSAKVKDCDVEITYEYCDDYLAYFDGSVYNSYGMSCVLYQDVTKTNGMYFSKGAPTQDGYQLIEKVEAGNDYYIFNFINNPDFKDITFNEVFKSIEIRVK